MERQSHEGQRAYLNLTLTVQTPHANPGAGEAACERESRQFWRRRAERAEVELEKRNSR